MDAGSDLECYKASGAYAGQESAENGIYFMAKVISLLQAGGAMSASPTGIRRCLARMVSTSSCESSVEHAMLTS